MENIMTILIIIIIVSFLLMIYAIIYNKFQVYIIKINTVENNLDESLRSKFDLLNKNFIIAKDNTKSKIDELDIFQELKDLKISSFDLDRKLTELEGNCYKLKNKYPDLNNNDHFNQGLKKLEETNEELIAYKEYYNNITTKFNKLIRLFPSNMIGKISGLKERLYYDGKDLSDEDINDFKL